MTDEEAGRLAETRWNEVMKALRTGDLEAAEKIAAQMTVKSDAILMRAKIKVAKERCT